MYTWKTINKSDYTIRKFNAYKSWSFSNSDTGVKLLEARDRGVFLSGDNVTLNNELTYNKYSLYGAINAKYYSINEPRILLEKSVLHNSASVFSVPKEYIGEGIKEGSLSIYDAAKNVTITDNMSGSILSGSTIVGDIFYTDGIVIYTHTASLSNEQGAAARTFSGNWTFGFKSNVEITENEILISLGKNEFNISRNPSAVYTKTIETQFIAATKNDPAINIVNYGEQYIRKTNVLQNGTILDYRYGSKVTTGVSGGFEHYYLSSSTDSTGSFLTPFITTIGLYDDANELLAVAKLPRPIKNEPSYPVNFIVRFDT